MPQHFASPFRAKGHHRRAACDCLLLPWDHDELLFLHPCESACVIGRPGASCRDVSASTPVNWHSATRQQGGHHEKYVDHLYFLASSFAHLSCPSFLLPMRLASPHHTCCTLCALLCVLAMFDCRSARTPAMLPFALCMLHSLISLLLCVPCSMSVCANHFSTFSSLADLRLCYDALELLNYCQQHFPFLLCLHHVAVSLFSYICDACATQFCLKAWCQLVLCRF